MPSAGQAELNPVYTFCRCVRTDNQPVKTHQPFTFVSNRAGSFYYLSTEFICLTVMPLDNNLLD